MMERIEISTSRKTCLVDITRDVERVVKGGGVEKGICFVFVPHTTAAIIINENADPSVGEDILMEINKIVPFSNNYSHLEGNAAAHIKSSIIGQSATLFIENGRLVLGRWQGIYFCEFDGPRRRGVWVKVIEDLRK
ncbi:MAG: secondary thiamine-phosphate synthase enzyme YjbQ [bacterium]|nr:secondary thiamine-phosphate synthase enzyme YjbQ [bacterium]